MSENGGNTSNKRNGRNTRVNAKDLRGYANVCATALESAIRNSFTIRKISGDINPQKFDLKDVEIETENYQQALAKIHTILLGRAKTQLTQLLKHDENETQKHDNIGDDSINQDNDPIVRPKKRKRAKANIADMIPLKNAKRLDADKDLLDCLDKVIEYLNDKYGPQRSFQKEDNNKRTLVRILMTYKDVKTVYALVGKHEYHRTKESKMKGVDLDSDNIDHIVKEEREGYTFVECFDNNEKLLCNVKIELIKRGDVVRVVGTKGSPSPIPSIKGNIIDDLEGVLVKMSKYSVQSFPIDDDENDDDSE